MKVIQIICPHNNAGLTRDRQIIADILTGAGHKVILSDSSEVQEKEFDIDIYIEHLIKVNPKSKYRIFIPNPEWFEHGWHKSLNDINMVLAKTKDCMSIFKKLHRNVVFTSFTSYDRYLPDLEKQKTVFHSCGKSQSKGTNEALKVWSVFRREPLPPLQFYARPELIEWGFFKRPNLNNVDANFKFIPDEAFRIRQNRSIIHLCPSIYEGFGHYINEAKSCGNVVITLNAAPMNELITNKTGVLSKCLPFKKMKLAKCHRASHRHLLVAVTKALSMSMPELLEMGQHARQSFLDNDKFFKEVFLNVITDLR